MTTQPEQVLENNLIKQLVGLGYEQVKVTDDAELVANLKVQLERLNQVTLTDHEFKQILNEKKQGQAPQFWSIRSEHVIDNVCLLMFYH